jgi:hypothetical protein
MIALEALRANKIRAFLTTLGVVIGSSCIVLVVTIGLAGRRYVEAQIEGVGSNLVYVRLDISPNKPILPADELSVEDMNAAKASIQEVVTVAGARGTQSSVMVGAVEHNVSLVGATEGFQQIRNMLILRGRFLDADDMISRSKVCLITSRLAHQLFPYTDPIGHNLRVDELSFTVIGVFKERVETFGLSEIQDYSVLIPFPLMKYYVGDSSLDVLYAQASTPQGVGGATGESTPHSGALCGDESEFDPEGCATNCIGANHSSGVGGSHRPGGQRNRNHEHHAGNGTGTYPGDWDSQSDWGSKQGNSAAVLTGGVFDQWIWIGPGHPDCSCDTRRPAAMASRRYACSSTLAIRGNGISGFLPGGRILRIFARGARCEIAALGIAAIRIGHAWHIEQLVRASLQRLMK